ncbi:hypothetical protein GCM10027430_28720 [Lysobacter tyrosinilyticus]
MNDADAGCVVLACMTEKRTQQSLGFTRIGTMQVQFVLHGNLATAELLQCAWRQRIVPIGQYVAGFGERGIEGVAEFFARGGFVALGHARTWLGLGRRGRWGRIAYASHRPNGGAEQVGVVVLI